MARIRTLKPDFFTDSKTGRLSALAKVLFEGLWCHADDYGVIRYDPDEFKAKILPYERGSVDEAVLEPLEEILEAKLAVYFTVTDAEEGTRRGLDEGSRGVPHLWITNFVKHQKIDRPSGPTIPDWDKESSPYTWPTARLDGLPEFETGRSLVESSPRARRVEGEGSTRARAGIGEERSGREGIIPPTVAKATAPPPERGDVQQLCEAMAHSVEIRDDGRKPAITAAWRKSARLLLDEDQRPLDEALSLIDWVTTDSFWAPNVLSLPKFRDKYAQLKLKRNGNGAPLRTPQAILDARRYEARADDLDAMEAHGQ